MLSLHSLLKYAVALAFLAAIAYFALYEMALLRGMLHDLGLVQVIIYDSV